MAHPQAGKRPTPDMLVNVPRLVSAYYTSHPDPHDPAQHVCFGTSGHRGQAEAQSFNEDHILAMSQAVCDYRATQGHKGPLFMGMDTHALSEPAHITALEVLAANGVQVRYQEGMGPTPTPVISHAILTFNASHTEAADGIVITPSHNPPEYGGFKYNPPQGGPAPAETTAWIEDRANRLLLDGLAGVKRTPHLRLSQTDNVAAQDFAMPYVRDLGDVLDLKLIADSGLKLGADPMGGSNLAYWDLIAETWGLDIEVVNRTTDPTFSFMPVDGDGKIRMDCSSAFVMTELVHRAHSFDVAFGNDPDSDRHGIVTSSGLMNPNHYLAVAIEYLFAHRPGWPSRARIGKTLVSSSMIDRVAQDLGRRVREVPVGFKWFVDGLLAGELGFGGEESAGASFLRLGGGVWTTDKDGIIMDLLAAEMLARTGADPARAYEKLTTRHGEPVYQRLSAPASREQKKVLKNLTPEDVSGDTLAGEPITARLTRAPGNDAPIGGLKVVAQSGWFAARPSGTEDIYKIYTESFKGGEHLAAIQEEARHMVSEVFRKRGV
jgi:phosphoglucomutase